MPFSGCITPSEKTAVVVFAVVDVAQVHLVLAREEEFVRRRKNGERSGARVKNLQPVASLQIHRLLIRVAAEFILLPHLRMCRATPASSRR